MKTRPRTSAHDIYRMIQNQAQARQSAHQPQTSWLDEIDSPTPTPALHMPHHRAHRQKRLFWVLLGLAAFAVLAVKMFDVASDIAQQRTASRAISALLDRSVSDSQAQNSDNNDGSLFGGVERSQKQKVSKEVQELQEAGITPLEVRDFAESEISTAFKANIKGKVQKLSAREQQLKTFEAMLRITEERLQQRQSALEQTRDEIKTLLEQYEQTQNNERARLVGIYSSLEPKRAAAIFNDLDVDIITDLFAQMTPRKSAQILGYMNPQKARIVTRALSGTNDGAQTQNNRDANALDALGQ